MPYFTKNQFAAAAQARNGGQPLAGYPSQQRSYTKSQATTTIFLSHSHTERPLIEQAKIFFENLGISIYVDWADETMPQKTSGVTAEKIKQKIITENDKFILLATNNALASKWCNWEVGIADFHKLTKKKMALLPLAENNGSWEGNEYLQIYPSIERSALYENTYIVKHPNGGYESLNDWLRK